jgi:hypothetical protein
MSHLLTIGSKAQVYHGTAKHTSGGLTKRDLMQNKRGRIISKKKHALGMKNKKFLKKDGYLGDISAAQAARGK